MTFFLFLLEGEVGSLSLLIRLGKFAYTKTQ